jgi:hypothetical protein
MAPSSSRALREIALLCAIAFAGFVTTFGSSFLMPLAAAFWRSHFH